MVIINLKLHMLFVWASIFAYWWVLTSKQGVKVTFALTDLNKSFNNPKTVYIINIVVLL